MGHELWQQTSAGGSGHTVGRVLFVWQLLLCNSKARRTGPLLNKDKGGMDPTKKKTELLILPMLGHGVKSMPRGASRTNKSPITMM